MTATARHLGQDAPPDPGRFSAGGFGLLGRSSRIASVRHLIGKAARTPFSVLLLGESGTGKEVVARAIHRASDRADKQFVVIDCGSLVGNLMESELFGHVRGAFSGAAFNKRGLAEIADGGTAFFDEIGDLPLEMQVKLLRLIQEGECRPVGALYPRTVDLRIIAATHRNLAHEVAAGRFRLDLYHRLNVLPIQLPPLRERKEDIPLLVDYFLRELRVRGLPPFQPSRETLELLAAQAWPGNVRELKHCIERMVALQSDGISADEDLAELPACPGPAAAPTARPGSEPVMSIRDSEVRVISAALVAVGGNRAKAADILGISRTTLYRRMKEYGSALPGPDGYVSRGDPPGPANSSISGTAGEVL